jgi:adenylate cyclase
MLKRQAILGWGGVGLWSLLWGAIAAWQPTWEQRLQGETLARMFELRGRRPVPQDIVLVALDDNTFSQIDFYQQDANPPAFTKLLGSFPWPRQAYAVALDRLFQAGAEGVGIDIVFADPSGHGRSDDQAFQSALQRYHGRLVLGSEYLEEFKPQLTVDLVEPHPYLQTQPPTPRGYTNALPAADGRILNLPSSYRQTFIEPLRLKTLPSLAEAVQNLSTHPAPDPPTAAQIDYLGPPGSFKTVSFWDLIDPQAYQRLLQQGTFKNRWVLIGPTAASFQDLHRTPFADRGDMPGVEIHANALATLRSGRWIQPWPTEGWQRGLLVAALAGGVGALCLSRQRPLPTLLIGLGAATGWLGLSFGSFALLQRELPTVLPISALVANGSLGALAAALRIQRERERLRRSFNRYVSPAVVQEILKQPEDYESLLKGQTRQATILFSDIRGFTPLTRQASESGNPEALVTQLNQFLGRMVDIILEHGGTIDKFIGDAIMAEFGVPVSQGDRQDALNAVRAAQAMRQALVELNTGWQQQGKPRLAIGIGLNYGSVIVGNIGSPKRLEYTVIGDAVNVASRIEGLTKESGCDLLLSTSIYTLLQGELSLSTVGTYPIKGHGPQQVYTVKTLADHELLDQHNTERSSH